MGWLIGILVWFAISLLVGLLSGRFIAFGMGTLDENQI